MSVTEVNERRAMLTGPPAGYVAIMRHLRPSVTRLQEGL
jgi:hypothetical protein